MKFSRVFGHSCQFSINIRKGNVHKSVLSACERHDKECSENLTLIRVYVYIDPYFSSLFPCLGEIDGERSEYNDVGKFVSSKWVLRRLPFLMDEP